MIQKYTIGRAPDNNIVVNHPTVSGYHADLIVSDAMGYPQYTFVDHSTNGTMINGQLLRNSSCFVVYGDSIILAGTVMFDWSVLGASNFITPHTDSVINTPGAVQGASSSVSYRTDHITFVGALKSFFQKYVDFSSRATRSEYWYMVLWSMIFSTVLFLFALPLIASAMGSLADILDYTDDLPAVVETFSGFAWYYLIVLIYDLAMFLPSLALLTRRIHDTGKSGLWLLMLLIPIANIVFFFIWTLTPSEPKPNKWGR